ncbi:MAG: protein kinase [Gemmataceae bacterium]
MELTLGQTVRGPVPPPSEIQPEFPDLEILAPLGRGGMGLVYKARQRSLGRDVAVKLLAPDRATDPAVIERFLREAQALARLNHPNIVTVYDTGRTARTAYLVMEFVDGQSLRDRLREGPLSPAQALGLVPPLCDALQYAHDQGVVHRDIKPENILLGKDGKVKIADFGLAKVGDRDGESLTGSGERMGTARYMAPEQWTNTAAVDHRADIYSLGVLIYELLTGEVPTPRYKPPSAKVGTDPRLDGVVSKSLEEVPDDRYQRAAEVKSDVERIANSSRWARPIAWGLFAALIFVVGAAVAFWPRSDRQRVAVADGPGITESVVEWGTPENLGENINSEFDDTAPFLSNDGLTLLFRSTRPGGYGLTDLWQSRRKSANDPFGEAVNLGPLINSDGEEDSPCMTADGLILVFTSNRLGNMDIWMARRSAIGSEWSEPEKLGEEINSDASEYRPWISPDGLTLHFHRVRNQQTGTWVATRKSRKDPFENATSYYGGGHDLAVGQVSFSPDGKTLYCNRYSWVYPGNLLWFAHISDPEKPFQNLRSFGPVVNSPAIDTNPVPSANGREVYFDSDRPGGRGGRDIWVTRRVAPAGK